MERNEEAPHDHPDYHGGIAVRGRIMEHIITVTKDLVKAIKESTEYERYRQMKQYLLQYPDTKKQVDEFRRKNYELQNSSCDVFEEADKLQQEYGELLKNPIARQYLNAESALCHVIQQVNYQIIIGLDFQTGLFTEKDEDAV